MTSLDTMIQVSFTTLPRAKPSIYIQKLVTQCSTDSKGTVFIKWFYDWVSRFLCLFILFMHTLTSTQTHTHKHTHPWVHYARGMSMLRVVNHLCHTNVFQKKGRIQPQVIFIYFSDSSFNKTDRDRESAFTLKQKTREQHKRWVFLRDCHIELIGFVIGAWWVMMLGWWEHMVAKCSINTALLAHTTNAQVCLK